MNNQFLMNVLWNAMPRFGSNKSQPYQIVPSIGIGPTHELWSMSALKACRCVCFYVLPKCSIHTHTHTHATFNPLRVAGTETMRIESTGVWILDGKRDKCNDNQRQAEQMFDSCQFYVLQFGENDFFSMSLIYDFLQSNNEVICIKIWIKWIDLLVWFFVWLVLLYESHHAKIAIVFIALNVFSQSAFVYWFFFWNFPLAAGIAYRNSISF